MRPVHIIGVPLDLGGGRRGVDMGPSAFRIAGLGERIAALGCPVVDKGDLAVPIPETRHVGDPRRKYIDDIATVCTALFADARASLAEGALPLVLGGDHSLAAGSVAATSAHARERGERFGLIWVDAHGDMNTPASTESGNVHGMPLSALLGPEPAELAALGGFSPAIAPDHVVLIGVRNLDDQEKQRVRDSRIHVFTMKDIDRGRHRGGHGAGPRPGGQRQPMACTSRSTSMSATPASRPESARRSKAASTTARRTW